MLHSVVPRESYLLNTAFIDALLAMELYLERLAHI